LTPNLDRCTLNAQQERERCQTPPDMTMAVGNGVEIGNGMETGTRNGTGTTVGTALDERIVVQFKTPISHVPLKLQDFQQQQQQLPLTMPKVPNQLRLNCGAAASMLDRETPPPMLSPLLRKALPKVNLTTIFCSSAPIAIDHNVAAFSFEPSTFRQSQSLLTPPETGNLSVQKSYSAPTLPNALSVSPRFAKQAAFYKRRSRHLSDRSDRSSLGFFAFSVYCAHVSEALLETYVCVCVRWGEYWPEQERERESEREAM